MGSYYSMGRRTRNRESALLGYYITQGRQGVTTARDDRMQNALSVFTWVEKANIPTV
jgi:hypothetical protein